MQKLRLFSLTIVSVLFSLSLFAQVNPKVTVSGTVADEKGEPIIGALIRNIEEGTGAVTDNSGAFSIEAPVGTTVEISYVSSENYTFVVGPGMTQMTINLTDKANIIDDLVVVAYGVQRKQDLTGSVSIVDNKQVQKMITANIGTALQGLASGVSVTTSGRPGATPDIRIRGVGSFSEVGPLYVIDGLIMDGNQREISLNDVESIQVLKDAAASSLYGSRGANGVIIVTTKRGTAGTPKVSYNADFGIQQIAKRYDMMNSSEFLAINEMAYENAGLNWPGKPLPGDDIPDTDWQDAFYKTGFTQNHNLSVSGGSESTRYMFSLGYYNEDGTVKGPSHERYSVRSNIESNIGRFTFGQNISFGRSDTKLLNGEPFVDLARMPPVIPIYDDRNESGWGYGSDAYPTYGYNPIAAQELSDFTQLNNRLMGTAFANYNPIKGLNIKTNIGVEYFNWHDRELSINDQIRYLTTADYENHLLERKGSFLTWQWENTVSYAAHIGKHKFDVLAGVSWQKRNWEQTVAQGSNLSDGYWVLNTATENVSVSGSKDVYSMSSILARLNYDYDNRYLVQVNYRRDGSSRFGANNRYGNYVSASLGWKINEEKFFENARPYFDELKLRASYGALGDQQAISSYLTVSTIETGEGAIFGTSENYYPGKIQKGRANPDLKWESRYTTNLGLDFAVLNNRLYGTVEWYNSFSKDLLVSAEMSWVGGTDINTWYNIGDINNRGFDITLGFREFRKDFQYDIRLNVSTVKTKIRKLDQEYRAGGEVNRSYIGGAFSEFWVIKTDGIFQSLEEVQNHTTTIINPITGLEEVYVLQPDAQPGDIRYVDANQNGTIDTDEDRVYVGKAMPDAEFGLTVSLGYKNFDFNLFLTGAFGHKIYNGTRWYLERMSETSNYPKGLSPWTPENPSTTTPRAFIGPIDNTWTYTDRWIENGNYVKIKNLQIGYTIPTKAIEKTRFISSARVYVGVQNLFTFTKYSGLDPEITSGDYFNKGNDWGHYPPVRTWSAGLQLTF